MHAASWKEQNAVESIAKVVQCFHSSIANDDKRNFQKDFFVPP
jgi:hypothetical protein